MQVALRDVDQERQTECNIRSGLARRPARNADASFADAIGKSLLTFHTLSSALSTHQPHADFRRKDLLAKWTVEFDS